MCAGGPEGHEGSEALRGRHGKEGKTWPILQIKHLVGQDGGCGATGLLRHQDLVFRSLSDGHTCAGSSPDSAT